MPTTLAIADSHEFVRYAVTNFAAAKGWKVAGEVSDAQEAVSLCARTQPSVLLMAVSMPGRDPLSAVADIRSASPTTRIVLLVDQCNDGLVAQIMRTRADGCLLKSAPMADIFEALERVASGTPVHCPEFLEVLPHATKTADDSDPLGALTPRELEVLRYIARGYNNQQMATTMSLSKRTVERHVARLMDALRIRERAVIQQLAVSRGIAV
ncbi:MAG: response regulator transcription factor [Phycisphaerales bacterium]